MADEQTVITRGEGGAPKGPQNAKERVYEKLRFIPINTNDYDEQEFDKSRIINVFEVIGSISKFF